ncbi:uncharacterized protein LOC120139464 [Hibiscus syriacus]|uniref:uncharacterized protein LOC120139464 n=1 Tax=Hibiscus syriacus TaxID=106335 RepID=UPI00192127F9|nr:uncharacterized protein LOC120139464 [Hibiscus syriacus]
MGYLSAMCAQKEGVVVVRSEDNELLPTMIVMGWRICIDCRKFNKETKKDHFPSHSSSCLIDWCMLFILSDMVEDFLETFMVDVTVSGIVKGHRISQKEIKVDNAKVEVIEKLPPPTTVKAKSALRD